MSSLASGAVHGFENLVVWADLLNDINVFPVADADTGTNLRVSLAPLRDSETDLAPCLEQLSSCSVGNSGNISAAFLSVFLDKRETELAARTAKGRDRAYQVIHEPRHGTMLDVFDALHQLLQDNHSPDFAQLRATLHKAVSNTRNHLDILADAGVVDSGALAMFLFFDGFFQSYLGETAAATPVMALFSDSLAIRASYSQDSQDNQESHEIGEEYCIDALLSTDNLAGGLSARIAALGSSAVIASESNETKIHLHTRDPDALKEKLSGLGRLESWSEEPIEPVDRQAPGITENQQIVIMTDAAGSLPLTLARKHNILLLDSYIVTREQALPESLVEPEQVYEQMRNGCKVTTAQASTSERNLHYQAAIDRHGRVLYLCTGSAYTGNYQAALVWRKNSELSKGFSVLDSGAASGRLAVIALLSSRLAASGARAEEVTSHAETLSRTTSEYVFIDELKYLVAGGRVSPTKGFFADLLGMKAVISPQKDGVRKEGVVRNQKGQLELAMEKLSAAKNISENILILLQYSDNKTWLDQEVEPQVRSLLPEAELLTVPLSLTSGVHMGPGTWSLAFADKGEL